MATADLTVIVPSCSYCCPQDSDAKNSCYSTSTRSNRSNQHCCVLPAAPGSWVFGAKGKPSEQCSCPSTPAVPWPITWRWNDRSTPPAESTALFLSAASVSSRRPDGRLSGRSVNTVLERIGRLHDAEHTEPQRRISPLRPHDLRHTFAFGLAQATNADPYELERRLGHRSQRYIARYTNPPEHIAATYIEHM